MSGSLSDELMKQHVGESFHNKEKVERAVREWFRIQKPEFCCILLPLRLLLLLLLQAALQPSVGFGLLNYR